MDENLWPHDRRQLVDDLWSLALANLASLPAYDRRVGLEATLVGRNLEPWRSLLAVALWLDERGVDGLWQRMNSLSERYQAEQETFESGDLTILVIRALWRRFVPLDADVPFVPSNSPDKHIFLTTKTITEEVKVVAEELEADVDLEKINARVIGRVLSKLRLQKGRPDGGKGRGWKVTGSDIQKRLASFGIADTQKVMAQTAHNGTNGTFDGTSDADDSTATDEAVDDLGSFFARAADERPVKDGVPQAGADIPF